MCRRPAGGIAFVCQNNKRRWINNIGEQIIVIYIWKMDGKGYICLENQASFNNDLCRLCVISHLHWWLNSEVFVDVSGFPCLDKSKGEFSIVYKKMSALLWLRVYNHDFVASSTPQGLFRYSGWASHYLFQALVLWCIARKQCWPQRNG